MIHQSKNTFINNSIFFKYSFSIKYLEKDWSYLKVNNIYLNFCYLHAIEQNASKNLKFIYVVLYQKNIPIGIVYFQYIHVKKDFFNQKKFPNEINSKITSSLLKTVSGNLLLCGNFFATGVNGFYFSEEIPKNTLQQTIQKLRIDLANHTQIPKIKFVMMKEFWTNKNLELQQEFSKNNACFKIDVNMILSIHKDWKVFDDYLSFMKTKYRTRAKSSFNKTEDIISKKFMAEDIKTHLNTIHKLYNSVLKTANFNMIKLNPASFYSLKTNLKEKFIVTGYFKDQQLIAFSTACLNNNHLDANYVGIDYAFNKQYPIYQRILYDYVKLAIQKRVVELRLGRTAETIKSTLGAVPKEMNLYIKHTNPILHAVFKPLTKYIKPSEHQIRKPFKKNHIYKNITQIKKTL